MRTVLILFALLVASALPAQASSSPCISIGSPSNGSLRHGVQLKGNRRIQVRKDRNWGTPEMVSAIERAVEAVHKWHPRTPRLVVGDLSRERGGRFPPHVSHQSGRDADLGYYFKGGITQKWFKRAEPSTLDVRRTWTLISHMLETGVVELMFVDHALQRELYNYAQRIKGLDEKTLRRYFSYPRARGAKVGLIRHLRGHADHMHIRFKAPKSTCRRGKKSRVSRRKASGRAELTTRVRAGDNLSKIAKRYKTTVAKLRRWNRLERGAILMPGQVLIVRRR